MSIGLTIGDLSILLVEPSATQLKVILTRLNEEGVRHVEGAATGAEALEVMQRFQPDLVVSAMYLPDMTATELVLAMRQSENLQAVPFMLVSSESHYDLLDPIRQAGVVAILPKPFRHEDLQRALRAALEYIDPQEIELEEFDAGELQLLLVDDSVLARNHMKRVLESVGITHITTAQDGKEGLRLFSEQHFDVIITDLNMPVMDGREMAERIRTDLGNTYIPIIVTTSEHDIARLTSVERAGVSAICDKPFDPAGLRDILIRALRA